jgi:hypothetical protein
MPRLVEFRVSHCSAMAMTKHACEKAVCAAEHEEALAFCRENKCGAKKCLSSNPDRWTHVKMWTLRERLKERVRNGRENDDKCVLTPTERVDLAAAMQAAALYGNPMDSSARNAAVCDILYYRMKVNKDHSRRRAFRKLSPAAKTVLKHREAGKHFWQAFFADPAHAHLERKKEAP